MDNYKHILLDKIEKLVSGIWDVPTFQKEYYSYYFDVVPAGTFKESEETFFDLFAEVLDWTAGNPKSKTAKMDGLTMISILTGQKRWPTILSKAMNCGSRVISNI